MWVKDKPKAEGWYLWRKMKTQNDQWKWCAYFIDENGDVWENGTNVLDPHGGWWSSPIRHLIQGLPGCNIYRQR